MQKELGGLIITKLDNAILCYFIKNYCNYYWAWYSIVEPSSKWLLNDTNPTGRRLWIVLGYCTAFIWVGHLPLIDSKREATRNIYIYLWDFIYFCGTSATDLDDWKQLRWTHFPYDLMIFNGPWCELTAGFKFSFKLEGSTAHSDNMITENRESNLLSLLKSSRSCSENCHFKRQIIINGAYFSLVTCPNHWYIVW